MADEIQELVDAVRAMRAAQKAWFADHTADHLILMRERERVVDRKLVWLQCNRLPGM